MQRLFLFGDSITAGYYQQEITDLLTKRIQENFPNLEVTNAGIPGDTTVDGLARVNEHVLRYEPTYVTVFFGANDAAVHRGVSLEAYQKNLRQLVRLIGLEKVILVSTPYANQKIQGHDRPLNRLRAYVSVAEELSQELSLPFINLLTKMEAIANPDHLLQADGLHFSKAGYDFLAQTITEALQKKINQEVEA